MLDAELCSLNIVNAVMMEDLTNQAVFNEYDGGIFGRLRSGEPIRLDDPEYYRIQAVVDRTIRLSPELNNSTDTTQIRERLSE